MDRCALFVDAGYLLADGAMAVHGTHRRESVTWDYPGLLQLLAGLAMERSRLPLLRCYWYDSTVEGRRTPDHDALADLPGVKLRLAKMRPGRREGVEGEIHRDLTTLARNKAVSDAMVVSAEEDLAQVIADVQDMGMRVTLLHIATDGNAEIPRALRQECDDIVEISVAQLRPYAELISGAEPPRQGERENGMLALRAGSNGNGAHGNGPRERLTAARCVAQNGASNGGRTAVGRVLAVRSRPAGGGRSSSTGGAYGAAWRPSRGEEQAGGREDAARSEALAADLQEASPSSRPGRSMRMPPGRAAPGVRPRRTAPPPWISDTAGRLRRAPEYAPVVP